MQNKEGNEIFPCTSCGLCCQKIGHIEELASFDRGDGVCIHLQNQRCSIYEERPDICRVDVMYHKVFHAFYTKEAFYRENSKICEELQRQQERNKGE